MLEVDEHQHKLRDPGREERRMRRILETFAETHLEQTNQDLVSFRLPHTPKSVAPPLKKVALLQQHETSPPQDPFHGPAAQNNQVQLGTPSCS